MLITCVIGITVGNIYNLYVCMYVYIHIFEWCVLNNIGVVNLLYSIGMEVLEGWVGDQEMPDPSSSSLCWL